MTWTAHPRNADKVLVLQLILNHEHLSGALGEALSKCRHRLFIATADVKELHIPMPSRRGRFSDHALRTDARRGPRPAASGARYPHPRGRGGSQSILDVFHDLGDRGVEVHVLHSGVPSGPFLGALKNGVPRTLTMRRCPRVHAKAVIADGRWMYLGSANLTGAGLGAKSPRRRNFETGIWTDDVSLIDPVLDMLQTVWDGGECPSCGRKEHCPVPLEEPHL